MSKTKKSSDNSAAAEEEKEGKKRRSRPIDASETYIPKDFEDEVLSLLRKRLLYLMAGNNSMKKTVNIQELADAVGISRPAVRKYVKPDDHGKQTSPSALTVAKVAQYFETTPDFLLGFDEPDEKAGQMAAESELYNRLGLNSSTLEKICTLRSMRSDKKCGEKAGELLSMLDRQISCFAEDALKMLDKD